MPNVSRLAARARLVLAAFLVSYRPLALTLPISACVASTCMEAIDRRLPEAKTSARPRCNNRAGAHRGGALPPTTGPRASLTDCSSHGISC